MRPFLDDTAQIVGTRFTFGQKPKGRSEREKRIFGFVLEKAEKVYDEAQKIGGVKFLPAFDARLMRIVYLKKYSKNQEGPRAVTDDDLKFDDTGLKMTIREQELAEQLVDAGNRLVKENLVQGTWGNLSVRVDDEYMLVTPSGIDYERLTAGDMVKVRIEDASYEKEMPDGSRALKPTSERGLHAEIYRQRIDVGAIVHTHSTYSSVFAAALKPLPVADKTDREIFGGHVHVADYGLPGTKKLSLATVKALGDRNCAIMAHHGNVVCGAEIEDAFANAVRIEQIAKEYLAQRNYPE